MGKSRSTKISANKNNTQLAVQEHETESPLIPVNQLKELNTFRPDLIDWVVKETKNEIEWRRKEQHRVNFFIFFERLFGQICGLIIGLLAIGGGVYVAVTSEHPWIGVAITGIVITGLAAAFFGYKNNKKK